MRDDGEEPETSQASTRPSALAGVVPDVCAISLAVLAVFFAADLQIAVGLDVFTEQGLAAILGLTLCIVFLKVPAAGEPRDRPPWWDVLFAIAGLAVGLWLSYRFPVVAMEFFFHQTEAMAVGAVLIPLTIEALRRTAGWSLVLIVLFFLVYGLFGHLVPGKLEGRSQELGRLLGYLAVDNVALFGLSMNIVCTIVVMFIFLGQLLLRSGGSEWFTDLATSLMGRTRGGSAKIAVVASGLFGAISGSAVSNVASTGVITIPLMQRGGFEPRVAGAFEAVASTGGQLMPPIMGAAAFLMAEFLQIGYTTVVLGALIPGVLYYVAVFVQADLEAARKGIRAVPDALIPPLGRVMREGWYFMLPFVLLIYALFSLNRTPQEAALWAAVSTVLLNWAFGYKGRRMRPRELYEALRDTGHVSVSIIVIGAMAGIIIGILEVTGLGFGLTFVLVQFGEGNLMGLLAITALICIVLGMGMPTTAIYILVATLAAPPLIKLGVEPLAAHLFVFYFGLVSLISPPVAVAAFVAANLAKAPPMATAVTSVRIGWTALVVPVLFVLSPNLIMIGEPLQILLAVVTAVGGVWLTSVGLLRYFVRPLSWPSTVLFLIAGIALLIPAQAFSGAFYTEIVGAILAVALVAREILAARRQTMDAGPATSVQ